ncbi:MAG: hypothetical protein M1827_007327 [Pycnora praestabilis]|nr:MAG: hypothetical protein M1827_007327 [Pycnora praestabilis]
MRLAHLRLPRITSYKHAAELQDRLVTNLLHYKSSPIEGRVQNPTIITAQFQPVYTCGRRELGTVSLEQQEYLRADGRAAFVEAMRGGQTTFHGPGQLVAYPIIDLKRHSMSPRDYVRLLETTLIHTCSRYGIKGFTTENPGVWTTQDRKIAAVGVHLRRNVTSHGVGLNVRTDLWWFNRIVACGLEGKETTSFEREGVVGKTVEEVGEVFVEELAKGLGIRDVDVIEREEVIDLKKVG